MIDVRSRQTGDPSQRVAEYWYCSDYCAREDLDVRINRNEEQMLERREANVPSFCFFLWSDPDFKQGLINRAC